MENVTVFAEDAKAGERKAVNRQILELGVKQTVNLSSDGSKCTDEDEVFEEAVDVGSPAIVSEDITFTKDGNAKLDRALDDKNGNSDNSNEAEFGEFVGTPCSGLDTEDAVIPNQLQESEEGHHGEQISSDNVAGVEMSGLMDAGIANHREGGDGGKNFDSAATAGETQKLINGKEVLAQSDQKPDHDGSSKLSYLEALTSGDPQIEHGDSREQSLQLHDHQEPTQSTGVVTGPKKHEIERFEMARSQDANTVEGGETHSDILESSTVVHASLSDSLNNEDSTSADSGSLKERVCEVQPEIELAHAAKGSEDSPSPESKSSGDTPHKNEQDAMLESGLQKDKCENTLSKLHSDVQEVHSIELEEKSFISDAIIKDDRIKGLKKLDSECVQVEEGDCEDINKEGKSSVAAADASTGDNVKEAPELDTNSPPALVDCSPHPDTAEVNPHSSLTELLTQSSSSSQPQLLSETSPYVSSGKDKTREQGGVIDEKKEINLSRTEEREIRPVSGFSLSSINSSSSDQAPSHPASLEHASKLQEHAPQDISANTDQEAKSTGESSSSSKPSGPHPHPYGMKHTALPGPGSQNKGRGSRPAADYLSTNASATPARPAGLGRAGPLLEPTSHHVQHPRVNGSVSAAQNQLVEESSNGETEEYDETREKLQMIRVKFLRLAHRLGQTPHNVVVAQVLYRLGLAEQLHGRSGGRVAAFSFDRASAMAEQLEAAGQEPLDFTCTIMVLGKSGVGKSATINSIFDEVMFGTDAFQLGTKKVKDIVGAVQGIRVRVIDTPGLLPSWSDQRQNEKILHSVKRFIKKTPPDIVLYLDRLDMQSRDLGDMPLLRTITDIFGPSIWFNAIVVLTHAASAPPEGPNGTATSYDMFVNQRSQVVQQAIRQAAGDMRLMNPVSLVENHSACRTNRAGQRVLPNGQVWKPHLLLLSFASKILAEANTLLKLQDAPPGRPFPPRTRSPPLPFLLSSLLQSRPEVKLPLEQFGDDDDTIDDDLYDCSDSEEESEYDELPPFKPLTKAQLEKLPKAQRKAYYDELDYRESLFMKKQLKEEKRRRKMLKKMQETAKEFPAEYGDNVEEEAGAGAATVPVPMPDLVLPASFDSDNPTHRYRSLDSSNPWLVRAVLEPNGWDHDIGYDGINVERLFVVKEKVPISFSGHISKDKKDANHQMEVASSVKHGKGKTTSLGFDMQSVGKDNAYTVRCETRFSNHRINKAAAGFSATVLGDVLTGGMKVEDKLIIGKRGQIVVSGGAIYGRGEAAYGGSLEATLRDKDHALGRFLSTLGLSVMDWHGDLAIGCNSQTQIPIGRHTNLIGRFNINNRGSGQFSVRINSSEQLQIVMVGLIPLAKKLVAILNRRDMDNDRSG